MPGCLVSSRNGRAPAGVRAGADGDVPGLEADSADQRASRATQRVPARSAELELDLSILSAVDGRRALAAIAALVHKDHPTRFYDRFVFIDLRKQGGRIEGWGFARGRITPAYRFWVSHVYGPLSLARQA